MITNENFNLQNNFNILINNKSKHKNNIEIIYNKDFKDNLRFLFIEQAKKYLGIPYKQKYFKEDNPLYYSHLFLDCCGLVRKVLRDLNIYFGVNILPYNQCYFFDILGPEIQIEDAKPGDLVFIRGKYIGKGKKKRQLHDIVHVEILLDNEKTIGARFFKGIVTIWDHYKFDSKVFGDREYIIKSIEPWLEGKFESYCEEHRWFRNENKIYNDQNIFSIFNKKEDNNNIFINKNDYYWFKKIGISVNKYMLSYNINSDIIYYLNSAIIEDNIMEYKFLDFYNNFLSINNSFNHVKFITPDNINNKDTLIIKDINGNIKAITKKESNLQNVIYQNYIEDFLLYDNYKVTIKTFIIVINCKINKIFKLYLLSKDKLKVEDDEKINNYSKNFYNSGIINNKILSKKYIFEFELESPIEEYIKDNIRDCTINNGIITIDFLVSNNSYILFDIKSKITQNTFLKYIYEYFLTEFVSNINN